MSWIQLSDCSKLTIYWINDIIANFLVVDLFLLSSLVSCLSFMSISSLVLVLWLYSLIRDWPETQKAEILPSEFCPTSGDWGELGIPNLARMSLIKCYWMLQNVKITAFIVYELRENQQGEGRGGSGIRIK